jgi:hypothetical protein
MELENIISGERRYLDETLFRRGLIRGNAITVLNNTFDTLFLKIAALEKENIMMKHEIKIIKTQMNDNTYKINDNELYEIYIPPDLK